MLTETPALMDTAQHPAVAPRKWLMDLAPTPNPETKEMCREVMLSKERNAEEEGLLGRKESRNCCFFGP